MSFVFVYFLGGFYGSTASTLNLQIENLGGGLKPGPNYSFPRFDYLPMWRWSAPKPSQPQLMRGQHPGRPTRVQTNKSRKWVSLVVGGIIETKPNPNPQNPSKSKIQNLKSKLQNPNPQNQNSKIQTPKIKIPRSKIKTPVSKIQDPNSKIQSLQQFHWVDGLQWFLSDSPNHISHKPPKETTSDPLRCPQTTEQR